MINSSLLEIFKTLGPVEVVDLKNQLSPEHDARALNLLLYIESQRDAWREESLAKRKVFAKLYPKRKYDDQRMREDMSLLSLSLKNYITQRELKEHSTIYNLGTLAALRKRGAWNVYGKQLRKTEMQLADNNHGEEYLLNQILLAQEKEQFLNQQPNRTSTTNLHDRMEILDKYYVLCKLKLYCEQLNRTQVLQADYHPQLITEILQLLNSDNTLLSDQHILVYYHVAQMLANKEHEGNYYVLKELMPKVEQHFDQVEARNLYRYLQNYCIYHINKGNSDYFKQLLDIYQAQLANKLMLADGEIDNTDYKNIVTTGLRLKEFKWTLTFIEQYETWLNPHVRQGAYLYNKANYYYESGQLAKASKVLVQHNFSDIFYNMSARHLLLKIFFDQEEYEALDYQVESFRIYLMRNKIISATNKASNINFLKVMRRLSVAMRDKAYVANEVSVKRKATIEKAIANYQPLANKNWLTEKAVELP